MAVTERTSSRATHFYERAFGTPDRVVHVALWAVGLVLIASGVLLVVGEPASFWTGFDHVAAALAVIGLLLAFPALSYAASTEKIAKATRKDLESLPELSSGLRTVKRTPEIETTAVPDGFDCDELLGPWRSWGSGPLDRQAGAEALSRVALEGAIEGSSGREGVVKVLRKADVFVIGTPAGDTTTMPGQGTESDILHFTVDDHGEELVMMPVFTNAKDMREALVKNEDWQEFSVLLVSGGALLDNRDPDVTLVIDPWSELEFQLEP